jgi:hypothetical protein
MRNSRRSFKETVNETLRLELLARQAARHVEQYKVRAKNLGVKPGYTFDKPWNLIEEIEGPDYR